jgi:multiple sugar transport system permease protein
MTFNPRRMKKLAEKAGIYLLALGAVVLFLFPILWVVTLSFKSRADIFVWPPTIFGFTPTLRNFAALFSSTSRFPGFLLNSLIVGIAATVISLLVGVTAAYGLARNTVRGSKAFSFWMLSFRMLPPVSLVLPYYIILREMGLLGRIPGIAVTHAVFSLSIVIWMMKAFFEEVPREIEEAAEVDGCTTFQVFRLITLPLSKAAIAASAIFGFLTSWNEFVFAVILSKTATQTVPVAISTFIGEVYVSWGELAAGTVIGMMPALLLAFLGQRFLLLGLAPGGVKQ